MFTDLIVAIFRLSEDSDNANKEQYQALTNYEAVSMNIQPATAELTAVTDGQYGRTFKAFTAISGIKVGDRVTVSGTGTKYIVKGVQDYFYGPIPHAEIVLFLGDN